MARVLLLFPLLCFLAVLSPGNGPASWFLLSRVDSPSAGLHCGQRPAPAPPWCQRLLPGPEGPRDGRVLFEDCWSIQRGECPAVAPCTPLGPLRWVWSCLKRMWFGGWRGKPCRGGGRGAAQHGRSDFFSGGGNAGAGKGGSLTFLAGQTGGLWAWVSWGCWG